MELTPQLLVQAYAQGVFPMAHAGQIYWYDPDPRAILPLEQFHVSRSLRRTMKRVQVGQKDGSAVEFASGAVSRSRKKPLTITVDRDFEGVIMACAAPQRKGAWIDEQIIEAYVALHRLGLAHSVETWQDGRLVGGLYGVALRGLFAGEAMFSHVTNASKVALVYLVEHLKRQGYLLLDVQFQTNHLAQFGVIEISRAAYQQQLQRALAVTTQFI